MIENSLFGPDLAQKGSSSDPSGTQTWIHVGSSIDSRGSLATLNALRVPCASEYFIYLYMYNI